MKGRTPIRKARYTAAFSGPNLNISKSAEGKAVSIIFNTEQEQKYSAIRISPNWVLPSPIASIVPPTEMSIAMPNAWREMRSVWHRQQNEPDYAFDTPVPAGERMPDEASAALAATIGELAPASIADDLARAGKV